MTLKKTTVREALVDAILKYSGEEFIIKEDLIPLVKESEGELIQRLIAILEWYHQNYHNESV